MRVAGILPIAALILFGFSSVQAQKPKVGFGLSGVASTQDPPIAMGFDLRVSWPINSDLSVAPGVGVMGFVFEGRANASYFFAPNVSAIVTLTADNPRSPYFIGGLGGYMAVGNSDNNDESGPTVHAGLGWTWLMESTAVYLEVSPMLVIARNSANVLLPVRFGVVL